MRIERTQPPGSGKIFTSVKIFTEPNSQVNLPNHRLFTLRQGLSPSTVHFLNTRLTIPADLSLTMVARKPKDSSAAPAVTRPKRTTKTTATIEDTVAVVRPRTRVAAQATPASTENAPATNPLDNLDLAKLNAVVDLLPELQSHEERLQQLDATFQNGYRELNTGLTEVKDTLNAKLSQLLERFDTMDSQRAQVPPLPQYRTPSGHLSGNTPDSPLNVLARWSWIDKTVVDSIALGEFDLNSLPKLHREQTLRNKHAVKTMESYSIPLDGSKPEIVTGRTKMDSAFPDLATFLSAWLMYISVRTTFAPERAAGLAHWTERIIHRSQSGFSWSTILDYIIAYFGDHQNSPPDKWFSIGAELVADHFIILPQKPVAMVATQPPHCPSSPSKKNPTSIQEQVCLNWNRPNIGCTVKDKTSHECLRRHICSHCSEGHKAHQCPSKAST